MLQHTELVPFYGDQIVLVFRDEQPFVAIRPICERLGIAWQPQHRKLSDPKNDWTVTSMMTVGTSSDGKSREMVCLSVLDFPLWMASIQPSKVAEDIRERLILYRRECKQVLFDHVFGRAQARTETLSAELAACHTYLLATYPRWARIHALTKGGAPELVVWRRSGMTRQQFDAEFGEMERCGLVSQVDWYRGGPRTLGEEMAELRRSVILAEHGREQAERQLLATPTVENGDADA